MPTDNPLLLRNPLPRFAEIRAAHVLPAISYLLERTRARLEALETRLQVLEEELRV